MPLADVRDVWVADATTRHQPAHRIRLDAVTNPTDGDAVAHPIYCPPGVAFGGTAITRGQAAQLAVFPCVKCFAITAAPPGGQVAVLDRGGPQRPVRR
jgi:hypothetical protein